MRGLRERGIVTGVTADVDLARLGLPVQAMVAIRFAGHLRADVDAFAESRHGLPGVVATYNITGANDFLVHVATATPGGAAGLRARQPHRPPGVVHAETSLVFHANRGRNVLPAP